MTDRLVINEADMPKTPDICGTAIDLINSDISDSRNISIATILIEPGRQSEEHYHKRMEEVYYIIDGSGVVLINGQMFNVAQGSAVYLPVGKRHQIKNTGTSCLKLIAADSPSFDETDVFH